MSKISNTWAVLCQGDQLLLGPEQVQVRVQLGLWPCSLCNFHRRGVNSEGEGEKGRGVKGRGTGGKGEGGKEGREERKRT